MPDADDFPVTGKDTYGDYYRVDVIGAEVSLSTTAVPLLFDAEAFEELSQVLIAARHVADQAVSSDG